MINPLLRFYTDNKKYWGGLIAIIFVSSLSGVFKVIESSLWGKTVDYGLKGSNSAMYFSAVALIVSIFADCTRTAFHYHLIGKVTESMFFQIRKQSIKKLTRGNIAVIEKKFRMGDVATRVNNDIDELSTFAAGHVSNFSRLFFQGVFAICGCLFLSWHLSSIYFIILPASLWCVNYLSRSIQMRTKKSLDARGLTASTAVDSIEGILTVKAFEIEKNMVDKFSSTVDEEFSLVESIERAAMKMTGVKYMANVIQTMVLFFLGAILVEKDLISVGTLISFLTLSGYISEPFEQLDYMVKIIQQANATAHRFYEILDIPYEATGNVTEKKNVTPCRMKNVSFDYSRDKPALKGITIRVSSNQKVAVVGESGCGKSTILKLMAGFYTPCAGSMDLFGVDLCDWNLDALRENLSIVTQDTCLFNGSIYENIAYGATNVTRQECIIVLQKVGMWDFVNSLEGGIDYQISETGHNLSGGQKQRICIARAMVRKAPLVLLDEVTSALDSETEKGVQKAIDDLVEGHSALIIAHRLNTVQNADYIYCMKDGSVVEEGEPNQLISRKGIYYDMCKLQGIVGDHE